MTDEQITTPTNGHGAKPTLAWLPVGNLAVDPTYQRSLESRRSQKLVAKIGANFSWARFGAVLVTPSDIALWWKIIDGQHRTEGARVAGIEEVPCIIVDGLDTAAQALAFVGANNDRVAVNSFALFHASVAAGEEEAVDISTACHRAGVTIPRYPIPANKLEGGYTLALGAIARIVKKSGVPTTTNVLRLIVFGWKKKPGTLRASLIRAFGQLADAAAPAARPALYRDMGNYLERTPPESLFGDAGLLRFSRNISEHAAIIILFNNWRGKRQAA